MIGKHAKLCCNSHDMYEYMMNFYCSPLLVSLNPSEHWYPKFLDHVPYSWFTVTRHVGGVIRKTSHCTTWPRLGKRSCCVKHLVYSLLHSWIIYCRWKIDKYLSVYCENNYIILYYPYIATTYTMSHASKKTREVLVVKYCSSQSLIKSADIVSVHANCARRLTYQQTHIPTNTLVFKYKIYS